MTPDTIIKGLIDGFALVALWVSIYVLLLILEAGMTP